MRDTPGLIASNLGQSVSAQQMLHSRAWELGYYLDKNRLLICHHRASVASRSHLYIHRGQLLSLGRNNALRGLTMEHLHLSLLLEASKKEIMSLKALLREVLLISEKVIELDNCLVN